MTAPRGIVILHPVRAARELTDPPLAEALAVYERRRVLINETLQEVIGLLAQAMADRYAP